MARARARAIEIAMRTMENRQLKPRIMVTMHNSKPYATVMANNNIYIGDYEVVVA